MGMRNVLVAGALAIGGAVLALWLYAPRAGEPASKGDLIAVEAPLPNALVASPLAVSGRARGFWYFEASFPVRILDARGNELGVVPAQAQGEWMTVEYVPFSASLTFSAPETETGTLVFEKDNPSGLPEHADELRIPIRFAPRAADGTR